LGWTRQLVHLFIYNNRAEFHKTNDMENKYLCKKCLEEIPVSEVNIINNKAVCPYCSHTLETDKFKVAHIIQLQETHKDKEE